MQRKKKWFVLVLVAVLVLSVTVGVFAEGRAANWFTFDGTCKRAFTTGGNLVKSPVDKWTAFHIYLTDITEGYDYAYARPVDSDGNLCGTQFSITLNDADGTEYIPNATGATAQNVHAKIVNPLYEEGTSSSTPIHIVGRMTGTN